jgi:purine-nucleoside/S-methyl-5'-thioadenosine phosphorylase / adenosine deaminase
LARDTGLAHGFSTRLGGGARRKGKGSAEFNLGFADGRPARQVLLNRAQFATALGKGFQLADLRQVHSASVYQVCAGKAGESTNAGLKGRFEYQAAGWLPVSKNWTLSGQNEGSLPAGDALLTSVKGVLLAVRTADCLPVLVADRRRRAVAAIHAGWRGALARVVEKTIGELRRAYSSNPSELVAAIGPGIGPCCYAVGDEVVEAFHGQFRESEAFFCKPPAEDPEERSELRYRLLFHTQAPPGHDGPRARLHLNLRAVARAQLLEAGLKPAHIHVCELCTACREDLFFSYRRDGSRAGRMMAAIGVRP